VTNVKLKGSLNLHHELRNEDLDFSIGTSSITYVFGSPGQYKYAATNVFMVGLANYRRSVDFPASVIDLGRVVGVGYVARQSSDKPACLVRGWRR